MANPWERNYATTSAKANPWDVNYEDSLAPKVDDTGMFRSIGDTGIALARGGMVGVKMLSDAAGAGNVVSEKLQSGIDFVSGYESPARIAEKQERARLIKEADASGSTWESIKAYMGSMKDAPIDTVIEAIGTMAPTVAAAFIPGGQAVVAARLGAAAVGGVQGAGVVKGSIYETVKNKLIESGASEDVAKARASEAQEYIGVNTANIAGGIGLGVLAGGTGVEKIISGVSGTAKTTIGRGLIGVGAEAIPEGAQGGQEKYASNVALQREGFDVPTFQGVAGSAALEAAASAPIGVGASLLNRPAQTAQDATPAPYTPAQLSDAGQHAQERLQTLSSQETLTDRDRDEIAFIQANKGNNKIFAQAYIRPPEKLDATAEIMGAGSVQEAIDVAAASLATPAAQPPIETIVAPIPNPVAEAEQQEEQRVKLVMPMSENGAQKRADELTARTGVEHVVIPHSIAQGRFTATPITPELIAARTPLAQADVVPSADIGGTTSEQLAPSTETSQPTSILPAQTGNAGDVLTSTVPATSQEPAKEISPVVAPSLQDEPALTPKQKAEREPYTGATMAEVEAIQNIPTTDKIAEAISFVGEDGFKQVVDTKFAQYKPTTPNNEAMLVEAAAIEIIAKGRRDATITPIPPTSQQPAVAVSDTPDAVLQPAAKPAPVEPIAVLSTINPAIGNLNPAIVNLTKLKRWTAKDLQPAIDRAKEIAGYTDISGVVHPPRAINATDAGYFNIQALKFDGKKAIKNKQQVEEIAAEFRAIRDQIKAAFAAPSAGAVAAPAKDAEKHERQLREASKREEGANDVLMGDLRFVPFDIAVSVAKDAIESGAMRPFPAQMNLYLGMAMRDADRVLAAAKLKAETPTITPSVKAEETPAQAAPKPEAQHIEDGKAETATPAVVAEAIQESADNTPMNLKEARDTLLKDIDRAIVDAPTMEEVGYRYDRNGKLETIQGSGAVAMKQKVFSVKGDGKFTVNDTKEGLEKFRASVSASHGFKNTKGRTSAAPSSYRVPLHEYLNDGDYLTALEIGDVTDRPLMFGAVHAAQEKPEVYSESADAGIDGIDAKVGRNIKGAWVVIEQTTGRALGNGKTKDKALLSARSQIDAKGVDEVAATLARADKISQAELRKEWTVWAEANDGISAQELADKAAEARAAEADTEQDDEPSTQSAIDTAQSQKAVATTIPPEAYAHLSGVTINVPTGVENFVTKKNAKSEMMRIDDRIKSLKALMKCIGV